MPCRTAVMSIILTSLVHIVSLPSIAQVQEHSIRWRKLGFDPLVSSLYDCALVNDSIAIVVGEDGVIRRGTTIDSLVVRHGQGGLPAWRYVGWYADSILVCAGDDGAIGWSRDLGLSWTTESIPVLDRVVSIVRADQHALLATQQGVFRYSTETQSLERVIELPSVGVGFSDGRHIAAMANGEVLSSTDGGVTWTRDESLSTSEPLVRLRQSNGSIYFVHKRFITWQQQNGTLDTTYIPASVLSFEYSDIATIDSRFYFTGAKPTGRHAYSLDHGRTLTVAAGFAINATNAVAVSASRLLCVGDRGSIVFSTPNSAISDSFRLFGFVPRVSGRSAFVFEKLLKTTSDLYTVSSQPRLSVLDTGLMQESILVDVMWHGTQFRHASQYMGRTAVLVDTIADIVFPDGVRKMSRYIMYTKHSADNEWSRFDSPSWGISAYNSHAVGDGVIYFTGYEQRQLYSLITSTGHLDSISMPLSASLVYADSSVLLFRGLTEYLILHRGSLRFETRPNPIAGEALLAMGRNRRLFAIGTGVTGSGLETRFNQIVRFSDDLGTTWTTAFDMSLSRQLSKVLDLYADAEGRAAFVGVGEGIGWSTDNGMSWQVGRLPITTQSAKSVLFDRSNRLIVAGSDELLHIGQLPSETTIGDEQNTNLDPAQAEYFFVQLQAFDLLGREVGSIQFGSPLSLQSSFDKLQLPSGIYLFEGLLQRGASVRGKHVVP